MRAPQLRSESGATTWIAKLPHDFLSHRSTWRQAFARLIELEPESGRPDSDEKGFWKHELRAFDLAYRGCKPETQKFPSAQFQPRYERIEVDELAVSLEGVMPIQQNVPPRRWRHLCDQCQRLSIASRLVLRQQPRQDGRVVEDDRVADQPPEPS